MYSLFFLLGTNTFFDILELTFPLQDDLVSHDEITLELIQNLGHKFHIFWQWYLWILIWKAQICNFLRDFRIFYDLLESGIFHRGEHLKISWNYNKQTKNNFQNKTKKTREINLLGESVMENSDSEFWEL